MSNKDNKIDKVIDEVLESKRLKQGASVVMKLLIFGVIITAILVTLTIMNENGFFR